MAQIIDGRVISQQIKDEIKIKAEEYNTKFGRKITLAVVLVGENPASKVYVNNKIKACEYVGFKSLSYKLPDTATQNEVEEVVSSLATSNEVDGILVQLPLPKGLDEDKILSIIPPEKDVDGFSTVNVGKLLLGQPAAVACTPSGVIKMLKSTGGSLSGKNAVVIGRSNIVGKPMALLLLRENCTVTVCHSKTANLNEVCANADVLVAAIGRPEFVTADMVKDGAIVIDVGINRTEKGLVGDVDFNAVKEKCSYISPVPGGVGPMTIAMLMYNTYECALRRNGVEL